MSCRNLVLESAQLVVEVIVDVASAGPDVYQTEASRPLFLGRY
jgi:hypothetical protein